MAGKRNLFNYNGHGVARYKGCRIVIQHNSSNCFMGFSIIPDWYRGKGLKETTPHCWTERDCKKYIDAIALKYGYVDGSEQKNHS
jgi:hypothetical protein